MISPKNLTIGNVVNAMNIPSPQSIEYQEALLLITDLDFFEQELMRYEESITETLMAKRSNAGLMNDDPMEELTEIYAEV